MDRRTFLASLIGGLAAASFAPAGLAVQPQAASPADRSSPEDAPKVDSETLDKIDAAYTRYYRYGPRRRYWRRRYYYGPRYYRPYPYYRPYGYRPYRRYYGPRRYYW